MPLTPHQQVFLDFIRDFQRKNGFAPSQQEIALHLGYRSLGTVQKYLVRLRKQGLLEHVAHARRGVSVRTQVEVKSEVLSLPLLGRVAAGAPIEAIETQNQVEVPASWVKHGQYFVLEVMGNSMIEDGILHGDFILVKKQKTAERGQMIVALINDGATVKRFYPHTPKKDWIELRPANPEYHPIQVKSDQSFQIEGLVAGVIRKVV